MNPATLIYLAGPIDGVSIEDACAWREDLARHAPVGVVLFNPATAFHNVNKQTIQGADAVNRMVIQMSSAVVANLSGPGRAFGTMREIEFARGACGKLVVVAVGPEPIEALLAYDLIQAPDPLEALEFALEQLYDRGEV